MVRKCAVFLMIVALLVAPQARAQAAPPATNLFEKVKLDGAQPMTDVARGKPVTASSVEPNSPHVPGNAVDGNAATRWGSAYSDPQRIRVDLGGTYNLSRVSLNWETAFGRANHVQVSNDGNAWTNLFTTTTTTTGDGGVDDLTVNGSGRYVRVNGTRRGYSLWDLNVFGS